MKLSSLTLSLLALAGVSALAQALPDPKVGKVGATILTDIKIERDESGDKGSASKIDGNDLYFGRFLKPTTQVIATLKPDATYGATNPAGYVDGAYTPGYALTAEAADMSVMISALDTTVQLKGTTTSTAQNTMQVSNFTFGLTGGTGKEGTPGSKGPGSFITGATKKVHFNVGATLTLNAGQEPGLYTGTYTLTTAYN